MGNIICLCSTRRLHFPNMGAISFQTMSSLFRGNEEHHTVLSQKLLLDLSFFVFELVFEQLLLDLSFFVLKLLIFSSILYNNMCISYIVLFLMCIYGFYARLLLCSWWPLPAAWWSIISTKKYIIIKIGFGAKKLGCN